MAPIKTMNGTKLLILIGDGGSPETFVADCLINTERGIKFSSDVAEFIVPDCDDPEAPAWKETTKDGLMATISGSGMLHTSSTEAWFDWFEGGESKACRVRIFVPEADGGGYWQAEWHLTEFEITGNRNDRARASVTLVSNGHVSWIDAGLLPDLPLGFDWVYQHGEQVFYLGFPVFTDGFALYVSET